MTLLIYIYFNSREAGSRQRKHIANLSHISLTTPNAMGDSDKQIEKER